MTIRSKILSSSVCAIVLSCCLSSLNRSILCHLKHDASIGSTLITSFELTLGSILDVESGIDYPVGADLKDKKGVKSGKLSFTNGQAFSSLSDLQLLCQSAGLQPTAVPKTKETVDLPPLGLNSLLVENANRMEVSKANPQPIAFGRWEEKLPSPTITSITPSSPATTTSTSTTTLSSSALPTSTSTPTPSPKPIVVTRKHAPSSSISGNINGNIGSNSPLGIQSQRMHSGHRKSPSTQASPNSNAGIMSMRKK